MKSIFLIAAILSGLCAEAMASPLSGILTYFQTASPILDDFTPPLIERDLSFHAESMFEELATNDPGDLNQRDLNPIDLNQMDLNQVEENHVDAGQSSGSLRMPEPPPLVTIALGLGLFGFFARFRHTRNKRRLSLLPRDTRRAITALQ
jgi:hypothetical protein